MYASRRRSIVLNNIFLCLETNWIESRPVSILASFGAKGEVFAAERVNHLCYFSFLFFVLFCNKTKQATQNKYRISVPTHQAYLEPVVAATGQLFYIEWLPYGPLTQRNTTNGETRSDEMV